MRLRAICTLVCAGWLAGCATLEHSLSIAEYAGRTLPTRGTEGGERLAAELEVDATLRDWVAANGRPDYLHVVDRMGLYFFYLGDDRAVRFERDLLPPSTARDLGRIPGTLLKWLPQREVDALLARREAEKRRRPARSVKRRSAPAPPAARAPSSGYVSRTFDVARIVAGLRPPLTAADAGVGGWRAVRYADGATGHSASAGSYRYEVRSDRLVLTMPLSAARFGLSDDARFEVQRLNGTIFGTHANAVTEQVAALVRSGSGAPVARRIRGRVVQVDRVPGRSVLVYSVRP